MTNQLPDDKKKELFRVLVEAQDAGTSVADSRQQVAEKFSLSVPEVIQVEREGVSNNWPPLDISFPAPELLAGQSKPATDGTSA